MLCGACHTSQYFTCFPPNIAQVEHGIGRTVHSANNRLDSAKRHKKSTRSSSQESRAHNQEHQIASESTAETAGVSPVLLQLDVNL